MTSTSSKPIVDIGIACNINQSYLWWKDVMTMLLQEVRYGDAEIGMLRTVGSALPDHNKNNIVGNSVKRLSLTDYNRTEITKGFLDGQADYIFWMDDDTAPPNNVISRLLKSGRDFIGGVYFLPNPPHHPIAYRREPETGLYAPVFGYSDGALIQIDSIGFGCTLVHRSVYEKIRDNHTVFVRTNGSLAAIHNSRIQKPIVTRHAKKEKPYIRAGIYHEQYTQQEAGDTRQFPYYQLEYGRTEDHYFCELAESVGIKPWLDTSIVCTHYKMKGAGHDDYKQEEMKAEGLI